MKYIVYALIVLLVCWSVWYVLKTVRRQVKGDCGCGCSGGCAGCGSSCSGRKS